MNVSVGIINYNGERTLAKVIANLLEQKNVNLSIKVYDNCSTDCSVESVQRFVPRIEVERMNSNVGPNPLRNKALRDSSCDYTLIMDNDIYFERGGLGRLVEILESNPNCMACSPMIAFNADKDIIQYNGVRIHYIGATIINTGRISELRDRSCIKSTCLGAGALLIKNRVVKEIGFFDEDFFFGWEDGDFTFRITSAGYDCLAVPEVVAYHDAGERDSAKMFFQIRNRWYFILKNYYFHTILLISPALILYEMFLAVFLTLKRSFLVYVRANISVVKNLRVLLTKHKETKRNKSRGDRELLCSGEIYVRDMRSDDRILTILKLIVDKLFSLYWNVVRVAVK